MTTSNVINQRKSVAPPVKVSKVAERQKGEIVTPERTLQLVKTVGVTEASRKLGVSTTTLHKARKQNSVSRVIEVAADGLLAKMDDAPVRDVAGPVSSVDDLVAQTGRVLYLVQVDASKGPLVERLGKMLDAEIIRG